MKRNNKIDGIFTEPSRKENISAVLDFGVCTCDIEDLHGFCCSTSHIEDKMT